MQNKRVQCKLENKKFKKNRIESRTCYYFGDIIKLEDFDFNNVLIHEKLHKNILIYDISYKTLSCPKTWSKNQKYMVSLNIMMEYLVLLAPGRNDTIYDSIGYLISLKSSITCFAKIKADSYDSLSIEKMLTLDIVIIHSKSVLNKDENNCYCKIF